MCFLPFLKFKGKIKTNYFEVQSLNENQMKQVNWRQQRITQCTGLFNWEGC